MKGRLGPRLWPWGEKGPPEAVRLCGDFTYSALLFGPPFTSAGRARDSERLAHPGAADGRIGSLLDWFLRLCGIGSIALGRFLFGAQLHDCNEAPRLPQGVRCGHDASGLVANSRTPSPETHRLLRTDGRGRALILFSFPS